MSVDVVGYLRRSYDGGASTSSVMISDTEEHQTSGYKPTSVFAEKKKKKKVDEAQKKLLYWTEIEGCEDCKKYGEEMKKAISKDGKEKAKKHFLEAAAATFRAAAHLSDDDKEAWVEFQEKYGATKAERWANKWLKHHASRYDEKAFDDVDFAASERAPDMNEYNTFTYFCSKP